MKSEGWHPAMNQAQCSVRQIGMWSALSTAIVGIAYVSVGTLWVLFRPPGGTLLRQVDPYLAILEILIILSALTLVTMMCAVHLCAKPEQRIVTLAALRSQSSLQR